MTGLRLFSRTSSPRCFNLASYHDPRSLTWSWVVSWSFYRPGFSRRMLRVERGAGQTKWVLHVFRLGTLSVLTQRKMMIRNPA